MFEITKSAVLKFQRTRNQIYREPHDHHFHVWSRQQLDTCNHRSPKLEIWASALLRNIQNIIICMGEKTYRFCTVTNENERISIKNSLPYLKCVTSLLCGPRADLWPFYGFLCKRFFLNLYIERKPFIWTHKTDIFRTWATCDPIPLFFQPTAPPTPFMTSP